MRDLLLFTICSLFLLFSCKNSSETNNGNSSQGNEGIFESGENIITENLIDSDILIPLDKYVIPDEHIEFFKKDSIGSLFEVYRLISPIRGLDEKIYLVNGDIELPFRRIDSLNELNIAYKDSLLQSTKIRDSISAFMQIKDFAPFQYRTRNLVRGRRTIRIAGANITNSGLRTAITNAIANYNQLGLRINFQFAGWHTVRANANRNSYLRWRRNNNIDIVITEVAGTGGRAGFPFNNGLPYDFITIGNGIVPGYGVRVAEHVVTHEIGHCVGLRHTDFFNRSISCGRGGNEGDAGVGAIHIPGTPRTTNIDRASIMLSCYNSRVSGEFSSIDRTALNNLYRR